MKDEDVIEVYGYLAGSEEDFNGDGRRKSDSTHLVADPPVYTLNSLNDFTIHQSIRYDNPHNGSLSMRSYDEF